LFVGFFMKRIDCTGMFSGSLMGRVLVLVINVLQCRFPALDFSYLWYNFIGCVACVLLSLIIQAVLAATGRPGPASSSEWQVT